ncbi:MAG: molybdenum cofactor guanylyltransferase [Betaproteobacteria bacterium]|nr:molybdenum cofactor guanylyltransferase [Betaproteobacteria bacterium]
MGGEDKGLLPAAGKPLAQWTAAKLRPQTAEIIISANRNAEKYAAWGRVVGDKHADFCGPLAGIYAGLCAVQKTEWAVSVPCDSPFFPNNLTEVLFAAAHENNADIAVAVAGRPQPVFMLLRTSLAKELAAFLGGGGRKIDLWVARQNHVFAQFLDGGAFDNINTPEELAAAAKRLGGGGG